MLARMEPYTGAMSVDARYLRRGEHDRRAKLSEMSVQRAVHMRWRKRMTTIVKIKHMIGHDFIQPALHPYTTTTTSPTHMWKGHHSGTRVGVLGPLWQFSCAGSIRYKIRVRGGESE